MLEIKETSQGWEIQQNGHTISVAPDFVTAQEYLEDILNWGRGQYNPQFKCRD